MKLILIAGARPNFMKIASIIDAIKMHNSSIENSKFNIQHLLVHTGQHYDSTMSEAFFKDLELPKPDIYLGVGSASHAVQTAEIMKRFEPVLIEHQPDVVILVGDVNSTVACALVASKIVYPNNSLTPSLINRKVKRPFIAHVEAGLRSFDRTMPEEINRILTDAISDFLFTTEESANENLKHEGISKEKVFFVGNTMIDTLLKHKQIAQRSDILQRLSLSIRNPQSAICNSVVPYAVLTLHRPSNVDGREAFQNILEALLEVSKHIPIIFPAHPRTINRIKEFNFEKYFKFLSSDSHQQKTIDYQLSTYNKQPVSLVHHSSLTTHNSKIYCIDPLGYLDFLCLMKNAKLVLTDSGGIQEETTILGIPCITLRENTERPITVTQGTNVIVGTDKKKIVEESFKKLNLINLPNNQTTQLRNDLMTQLPKSPPLWDGKAGQRIIQILVEQVVNSR